MDSLQLELDELIEVEDAAGATPSASAAAPTKLNPPAPSPPPVAPAPSVIAKGTGEVELASLAELEARLDRCLAGLQMHFQPIVYPDRGRFGYEALLRSTDKSLPHPGAILDAAERLERTARLGQAIRAQVAKVFAAAPPDRGVVFINLHINDLLDRS